MDAPRRRAFNPLVTVSTQYILAFRTSYPSINAIQTRLYPAGRAGDRRERAAPVMLKTLRPKAKVERRSLSFPASPHLSSDLPRSFFRMHAGPSALCSSVFRNIPPDIVPLLHLPLFSSFSLSLLCNDRPSPPGTS